MTDFKTRKRDKQVFPVSEGKEHRRKDDYSKGCPVCGSERMCNCNIKPSSESNLDEWEQEELDEEIDEMDAYAEEQEKKLNSSKGKSARKTTTLYRCEGCSIKDEPVYYKRGQLLEEHEIDTCPKCGAITFEKIYKQKNPKSYYKPKPKTGLKPKYQQLPRFKHKPIVVPGRTGRGKKDPMFGR